MRTPRLVSLLVCSLIALPLFAQLPPLFSPEIPVSDPVITAAPLEQSPTAADSNGEVALVAWEDSRSGASEAYAARIGANGAVLDPLGIRLGQGIPRAVVWNGDAFIVVLELPVLHELVWVDAAGVIVHRRGLDVEEPFTAAIDGPEVRLLFLNSESVFSGATRLRGVMVDPDMFDFGSEVITLPESPVTHSDLQWIGASNGSEILVLRFQRLTSGAGSDRLIAERIDANADLLSSTDTGLNFYIDGADELAGRSDGYVLVRHRRTDNPDVRSYRLTPAGMYTGETDVLGPPLPPTFADIRLVRDGAGYLFTWWAADAQQAISRAYATVMTTEGRFGGAELVGDWFGQIAGVAVAVENDHRTIFHGVRQRLTS
ncbi:MAG TPA: hypothetical protein VFT12_01155, partial [Thermoanaerobaculia bacterium]|nr:hypothetical protein [Thermoanaerobaculia bacterium]